METPTRQRLPTTSSSLFSPGLSPIGHSSNVRNESNRTELPVRALHSTSQFLHRQQSPEKKTMVHSSLSNRSTMDQIQTLYSHRGKTAREIQLLGSPVPMYSKSRQTVMDSPGNTEVSNLSLASISLLGVRSLAATPIRNLESHPSHVEPLNESLDDDKSISFNSLRPLEISRNAHDAWPTRIDDKQGPFYKRQSSSSSSSPIDRWINAGSFDDANESSEKSPYILERSKYRDSQQSSLNVLYGYSYNKSSHKSFMAYSTVPRLPQYYSEHNINDSSNTQSRYWRERLNSRMLTSVLT